jgi:hypothetical protein
VKTRDIDLVERLMEGEFRESRGRNPAGKHGKRAQQRSVAALPRRTRRVAK